MSFVRVGIALYFQNKNNLFHVIMVTWILALTSDCGSGEAVNLLPEYVTSYYLGTWAPLAKVVRRNEFMGM